VFHVEHLIYIIIINLRHEPIHEGIIADREARVSFPRAAAPTPFARKHCGVDADPQKDDSFRAQTPASFGRSVPILPSRESRAPQVAARLRDRPHGPHWPPGPFRAESRRGERVPEERRLPDDASARRRNQAGPRDRNGNPGYPFPLPRSSRVPRTTDGRRARPRMPHRDAARRMHRAA
jgi:hypothetical protein